MSAILGSSVTGAGGGAYTIDNSVRLRSSASPYLDRTPSVAGNRQKWTVSCWVKRCQSNQSGENIIMSAGTGAGSRDFLGFAGSTTGTATDSFTVGINTGSWAFIYTNALYRDPSSWYHVVVAVDTTQATAANRVLIYINGTAASINASSSYPALNTNTQINSTAANFIGRFVNTTGYLEGYLSEFYFIDGQALTPSSFGATNASTGVWQPTAYTGTYGTNGFYQKYSDIATTSGSNAGLGKDFSGNGNYWNTTNISVTAGVTYDAMTDSPTPKSSDVCNYAVLNPINAVSSSGTYSNGNLQYIANTDGHGAISTILVNSGKWYWEGTFQNTNQYGIFGVKTSRGNLSYFWTSSGYVYTNAGWTGRTIGTYAIGDVISITVDYPNDVMKLYKNNVYIADLGACSYFGGEPIGCFMGGGNTVNQWTANFGQRPFAYSLPSGFNKLCTYNITAPAISKGNQYFDALLYTGDGASNRALTGLNFQPDFVWNKARSNAYSHKLYDVVRGVTKQISSDLTTAEVTTGTSNLVSFDSNGITIGNDTGFNGSGVTFVDWFWKANGAGVTNTAGSITSTVSANTTSGVSIVTWTYNSSGGTIGHGLGAAPKMIIQKDRSSGAGYNWDVYTSTTGPTKRLIINSTSSAQTYSGPWNNTAPTSTVFSSGSGWYTNGDTMVSYCFAEVPGFSKMGSYTGNGSSDGPFVYCGFRPAYIMVKRSDSTGAWFVLDNKRDTYNYAYHTLNPNASDSEYSSTSNAYDFLSNGFKLRQTNADQNASGGTYIFMAFAENPFNYSLAR